MSLEFVKELQTLGYHNVTSDDLTSMAIHGVTTNFIRDLAAAGYHDVPVEKLIQMRIRGIDAAFVRSANGRPH